MIKTCKYCGKELHEREVHIAVFDKDKYRECWIYIMPVTLDVFRGDEKRG